MPMQILLSFGKLIEILKCAILYVCWPGFVDDKSRPMVDGV